MKALLGLGLRTAVTLSVLIFVAGNAQSAPAASPNGGTMPVKKIYRCAGQLTRAADAVITMQAGKAFYKATDSTAPVTTAPVFESGAPVTVAEANTIGCNRRVIEIRVPSTTSSGCANCYPNAEIHACAGSFAGSKVFEEYCRVPTSSTSEANCKTFKHEVEVFKKVSGQTKFGLTPLKTFVYRGAIDSSGCRVAAKNLGQIHDTAEVFPNLLPPATGMDVYRVLTRPSYQGALIDSVIFVEYESMR